MGETTDTTWEERADELRAHGVPDQRSNVVALREQGHSYTEIASILGFGADNDDRSQVTFHLDAYREARANAEWLAEHGPEV